MRSIPRPIMQSTSLPTKTISVRYLKNSDKPPVYMASVGGGEIGHHTGNYIDVAVALSNAREVEIDFHPDTTGFVLCKQRSSVTDFYDDEQISTIYADEVEQLVKSATGAKQVEVFDHTRRASSDQTRSQQSAREPASIVHNDYTSTSGSNRLSCIMSERGIDSKAYEGRRFSIINVWRTVNNTVNNHPLALCDAQTVAETDFVSVTRQAVDRTGELQLAKHNNSHRWYYYPGMTIDEALVFKTYDSALDGTTRFTLHTSFDEGNNCQRESIETRCFVFY